MTQEFMDDPLSSAIQRLSKTLEELERGRLEDMKPISIVDNHVDYYKKKYIEAENARRAAFEALKEANAEIKKLESAANGNQQTISCLVKERDEANQKVKKHEDALVAAAKIHNELQEKYDRLKSHIDSKPEKKREEKYVSVFGTRLRIPPEDELKSNKEILHIPQPNESGWHSGYQALFDSVTFMSDCGFICNTQGKNSYAGFVLFGAKHLQLVAEYGGIPIFYSEKEVLPEKCWHKKHIDPLFF